jgi:transposase
MAFVLSGGERHESLYVEALLSVGRVRRVGRGRSPARPGQLVGDKGYSYLVVRRALARRGIRAVIPRRRDQRPGDRRHRALDRAVYRERNRVERLVNRLKQRRRVATRYEKRATHYLAMLTVAAALLWL